MQFWHTFICLPFLHPISSNPASKCSPLLFIRHLPCNRFKLYFAVWSKTVYSVILFLPCNMHSPLWRPTFHYFPTSHFRNILNLRVSLHPCCFLTLAICFLFMALSWLTWSGARFPPRRTGFFPKQLNVGFVDDKVALEYVYIRIILLSPASVIPPLLRSHSFMYIQCDINLVPDSVIK